MVGLQGLKNREAKMKHGSNIRHGNTLMCTAAISSLGIYDSMRIFYIHARSAYHRGSLVPK
jgi:hypothetical protein